jgi:hypothetical protein
MPIARLYETEQQAQDAAARLSSELPGGTVHLLTPSAADDAARLLKRGGFDATDVSVYAAEIAKGRSLVAASPAFGMGARVKAVLDEFAPVAIERLPSETRKATAMYTPFSELLGLSLLTKQTQQAWWFGEVQLKRPDATSLGQPRLKRPDVTSLGLPRLVKSPTPFSSLFGLPLLKKPGVASLGFPRLLKNPTPLSSMLGLSTRKEPDVASLGLPRLKRK